MQIDQLDNEERIALVGLLREIVQADEKYTEEERASVKRLREQVGPAIFDHAILQAQERFKSRADLKAHAKTITRPEARRAIYDVLIEVAKADGLDAEEEKPLAWLASWWSL